MSLNKCTRCGEAKPIADFYRRPSGKLRMPCRLCVGISYRLYRKDNSLKERERHRKYGKANLEKGRAAASRYRDENRIRVRDTIRRSDAKRRSTPRGRLDNAMSAGIAGSLARNAKAGRSWQGLVGYSLENIMEHLELQFSEGMTWENYGQWHVDHIVPLSVFNYTATEHVDFRRAWSLTNLRPLWATENMRKHARLDKPFQPSFAL